MRKLKLYANFVTKFMTKLCEANKSQNLSSFSEEKHIKLFRKNHMMNLYKQDAWKNGSCRHNAMNQKLLLDY